MAAWAGLVLALAVAGGPAPVRGQAASADTAGAAEPPRSLDRVLTLRAYHDALALPQDRGAAALWNQLQRMRTTASVLHTTAHPDDEHADVLTLLSRRDGVRTALLTLNRGEGGANAIGSELFDGVGIIRTEELLLAGRYYALDDLYFTTAVDYGFSKTLDEAYRSWDREAVLGDMVRVIRLNRPMVVVSRWHGSARDGHGHHQASGDLTPEAVRAAADPSRFPEQIDSEGLRPWTPLRLYRGGVAEDEVWHTEVDANEPDPWMGVTYREFGARGLSLQRSQTSGRVRSAAGPLPRRYERMAVGEAQVLEGQSAGPSNSFFDGIDTSLSELFTVTGETPSVQALLLVDRLETQVGAAEYDFEPDDLGRTVEPLAEALGTIRELLGYTADLPEASFLLAIKERQIESALAIALGLRLTANAIDARTASASVSRTTDLGPVVPGQGIFVEIEVESASAESPRLTALHLVGPDEWDTDSPGNGPTLPMVLQANTPVQFRTPAQVGDRTEPSRPWFYRDDVADNHYQVRDSAALHLAWSPPPLSVEATVEVEGVSLRIRDVVRMDESDLPYGVIQRHLTVTPEISVRLDPAVVVVPVGSDATTFDVSVHVAHNGPGPTEGTVRLDRERGWGVEPATQPFDFDGPGQSQQFSFKVTPGDVIDRDYRIVAVASAKGRSYREGYDVIRHRDLETRRLYRLSVADVHGLEVTVTPGLTVGYVMGVGDEVPSAIRQLGAAVVLLDDEALAAGDLSAYDAIVVGTRAYAVRPALYAHNARLLEFANGGGHLVVLYQTQEFVPDASAPFPARLPRGAEEVSEEDAAVEMLAPEHPLVSVPNRLAEADFDGWIEQRGSKFFTEWDAAYTPLLETADTGQDPQRGIWLTAEYGSGRYTYCALALHRQLPLGVGGAYRILANLISATASP